jgi:hypothetical protein
MGIPVLGCDIFLILSTRILRVNSTTKAMQHRDTGPAVSKEVW